MCPQDRPASLPEERACFFLESGKGSHEEGGRGFRDATQDARRLQTESSSSLLAIVQALSTSTSLPRTVIQHAMRAASSSPRETMIFFRRVCAADVVAM